VPEDVCSFDGCENPAAPDEPMCHTHLPIHWMELDGA
jgi:hypothetical protein